MSILSQDKENNDVESRDRNLLGRILRILSFQQIKINLEIYDILPQEIYFKIFYFKVLVLPKLSKGSLSPNVH